MKVFYHHIYEYKKGLRNLVLCTLSSDQLENVKLKLEGDSIDYIVQKVGDNKINVFFGHKSCIEVLNKFKNESLTDYSNEEDFILGIMLGYDRVKQCDRYLDRK